MAKVGFEYVVAAELDVENAKSADTVKYKNARVIGPAANANGNPNVSDVKDYGDDNTVETDTSVTGGTVSLELNEPTMENEAWMLGHKTTKEGGMIRNGADIAPYLGVGFVGKSKRNGKMVYRSKIYLKSQFKVPNDENATKQESITFNHTTMEGNLFLLENGDWKIENEFESLTEAKAHVNKVLGLTTEAA